MAVILRDGLLDEINHAREKVDSRRLDDYVKLMHYNVAEQVALNSPFLDRDNASRPEEVIANFRKAWAYASSKSVCQVGIDFLQDVAGLAEPNMCQPGTNHAMFRSKLVTLKAGPKGVYTPPSDRMRIVEHLHRLKDALDSRNFHPVEEAMFLNFHLSRIQPFDNANKRTASIIMNSRLISEGYFPIALNEQDRTLYGGYFRGALADFQETSAETSDTLKPYLSLGVGQAQFYEFLGKRELSELKLAEDRLKGLHTYKITMDPRDKGAMFTAKRSIRCWFDRHGIPYQEKLNIGQRELDVTGEIPQAVLDRILRGVRGLDKYTISDKGMH